MREDELSALLRAPELSLDPPPDLVEGVRDGARRVRRRRRAAGAALAAVALAGAVLAGPGLTGPPAERRSDVASPDLSRLFPDATSQVVRLADLAGGTVYTYFRGGQWCTVSRRTGPPNVTCAGSLPPSGVRPFAFLRGPGTESLAVDRDFLVAGLLGDGVAAVEVELVDGRALPATLARGEGFPRAVWWARLPQEAVVASYTAYAPDGSVLDMASVVYDASYGSAQPSPRSSSE